MRVLSVLLLPLGVWLLTSAATPPEQQRALARWALVVIGAAALGFLSFGFGLGFGAYDWSRAEVEPTLAPRGGLTLYTEFARGLPQPIVLAGIPRPLLPQMPAAQLWAAFAHLPYVFAAALLTAGVVVLSGGKGSAVLWGVVAACVWLPLAFAALSPHGWLNALSALSSSGVAQARITELTAVGLVAGGTGLGWLLASPRRHNTSPMPPLPPTHVPWRAVAGALCVWIGGVGLVDWDAAAGSSFLSVAAALSVAVIVAGAYTAFVAREPDTLSAARAALGAVFMVTGAALGVEASLLAGLVAGLLATVGHFACYERWRLPDEAGLVAAVLAPSAIGALLQAQSTPVAVATGALAFVGVPATTTFALAALFRPRATQIAPQPSEAGTFVDLTLKAGVEPARTEATPPASAPVSDGAENGIAPAEATPQPIGALSASLEAPSEPAPSAPARHNSLLSRLFRRRKDEQAQPTNARPPAQRVAYPYRVGGRALPVRPLNTSTDSSDEPSGGAGG